MGGILPPRNHPEAAIDFAQDAPLPLASRVLVCLGWAAFFVVFVLRRKPSRKGETKRDPVSRLGIFLQMAGFCAVWMVQRPIPRAGTTPGAAEIAADVLAPILSAVSVGLGLWAVRTLGRQWSYTARLVEDHRLVQEGPYAFVRHPIYTAMLGKLLAVAASFGSAPGLAIAAPLFLAGTRIRVRSEEKLLEGQFGGAFADYARRVPAFIPFLK
ncbi:MAG TPA: isoprenylcysteine carboxylmethyltransferase family protein [Verrucomicrobiae bacterium]|nr:isoprenylcysteine carboxylmethyltransferase family protein [Verrucomicrobiae bacterium]